MTSFFFGTEKTYRTAVAFRMYTKENRAELAAALFPKEKKKKKKAGTLCAPMRPRRGRRTPGGGGGGMGRARPVEPSSTAACS